MATLIDYILIPLDLKKSCQCTTHEHLQSLWDPEVSKCNQSRWPSNCTGFHGHVMSLRKESIIVWLTYVGWTKLKVRSLALTFSELRRILHGTRFSPTGERERERERERGREGERERDREREGERERGRERERESYSLIFFWTSGWRWQHTATSWKGPFDDGAATYTFSPRD